MSDLQSPGFFPLLRSGKVCSDELFVRLGSLDWSTMARFCTSEELPLAGGPLNAAVATASLVLSKQRGWSWSTHVTDVGAAVWPVQSGD